MNIKLKEELQLQITFRDTVLRDACNSLINKIVVYLEENYDLSLRDEVAGDREDKIKI